jgi:hypothetical protein
MRISLTTANQVDDAVRMLRAEDTLAVVQRAPVERQGSCSVAQCLHASGQIAQADKAVGMLLTEHPLAAIERAPVEWQGPRRVAQHLHAKG